MILLCFPLVLNTEVLCALLYRLAHAMVQNLFDLLNLDKNSEVGGQFSTGSCSTYRGHQSLEKQFWYRWKYPGYKFHDFGSIFDVENDPRVNFQPGSIFFVTRALKLFGCDHCLRYFLNNYHYLQFLTLIIFSLSHKQNTIIVLKVICNSYLI